MDDAVAAATTVFADRDLMALILLAFVDDAQCPHLQMLVNEAAVDKQIRAWKLVSLEWCNRIRCLMTTDPNLKMTTWCLMDQPRLLQLPLPCVIEADLDMRSAVTVRDFTYVGNAYVVATLLDADVMHHENEDGLDEAHLVSLMLQVGDTVFDNAWSPLAQIGRLSRNHLQGSELYSVAICERMGTELFETDILLDAAKKLRRPTGAPVLRAPTHPDEWSTATQRVLLESL